MLFVNLLFPDKRIIVLNNVVAMFFCHLIICIIFKWRSQACQFIIFLLTNALLVNNAVAMFFCHLIICIIIK